MKYSAMGDRKSSVGGLAMLWRRTLYLFCFVAITMCVPAGLGCGRAGGQRIKTYAEAETGFLSAVNGATDARNAHKGATAFLASLRDPHWVRELALLCTRKIRVHYEQTPGRATAQSEEFPARYGNAWAACVERLSGLGKRGDVEAVEELWLLFTQGPYDAAGSEFIVTQISKVGEPAIPFLDKVQGAKRETAEELVRAIREGRVLE
jgi:hypothetical protein